MNWRTDFYELEPGASADALARLRAAVPAALPDRYFELLAFANGGEWHLRAPPYRFSLSPAEWIAGIYESDHWKPTANTEFLKGFVLIGTNALGETVGFDIRGPEPWPVVLIDMNAEEEDERVVTIAADFDAFLDLFGN
jgi:hypothetical protein